MGVQRRLGQRTVHLRRAQGDLSDHGQQFGRNSGEGLDDLQSARGCFGVCQRFAQQFEMLGIPRPGHLRINGAEDVSVETAEALSRIGGGAAGTACCYALFQGFKTCYEPGGIFCRNQQPRT